MSMFDLSGQVAVVTGGAGLLGIQHAQAIADAGGIPILLDINPDQLTQAKQKFNNTSVETYVGDITNRQSLVECLDWVKQKYQRLDILINNAAVNPAVESKNDFNESRLEFYNIERLQKEMNVGLVGALLCAQVFGKHMADQERGVILNIASDLGLIAPNQLLYAKDGVPEDQQPVKPVSYSIVKHGLIGLTRYLATYWAHKNVRCNALAPGGVENGQSDEFLNRINKLIPLGRMAKVDEYKAAVLFLVSEASSYMTGSVMSVDGGRTCW